MQCNMMHCIKLVMRLRLLAVITFGMYFYTRQRKSKVKNKNENRHGVVPVWVRFFLLSVDCVVVVVPLCLIVRW